MSVTDVFARSGQKPNRAGRATALRAHGSLVTFRLLREQLPVRHRVEFRWREGGGTEPWAHVLRERHCWSNRLRLRNTIFTGTSATGECLM